MENKYRVHLSGLLILLFIWLGPTAYASPKIESWHTSKGAKVLFVHAPDIPMVSLRVVFDAGSARETLPGLAKLTNGLLEDGAGEWDAQQIAERLESVGSTMTSDSLRDMASLSVQTLSETHALDVTMETLATVLGSPNFTSADLERGRQSMLSSVLQGEQSPAAVANKTFYRTIFNEHSYASEPGGTNASLAAINRKDILKHYQAYYVAENAIVAIVGDVNKKNAQRIAELVTSHLASGKPAPKLSKVLSLQKAQQVDIEFPSSQSHILIGQTGMHRGDPDYFPLYVGNHILGGGGLVSKLSEEVREKRGLSYSVYSYFSPMRRNGAFVLGAQTKNANVDEALKVIRDTVKHYVEQGPTAKELDEAKKNITGGFPLRIASNSKTIGYLAMLGFYDLPLDYLETFVDNVNSVSHEQIKQVFKKRLNPDKFATVVVGKSTQSN